MYCWGQPVDLFLCKPPTITSMDYSEWSDKEKIQFNLCWAYNKMNIYENNLKEAEQLEFNEACLKEGPKWGHVQPIDDVDYFDIYHTEIALPPELIDVNITADERPTSLRIFNELAFEYVIKILNWEPVACEPIVPSHKPLQCINGVCTCMEFKSEIGNAFRNHFPVYRDIEQKTVKLVEKDGKCVFPESRECVVQPNEQAFIDNTDPNKLPYTIPCFYHNQVCVITGNGFHCNRTNVINTIRAYNKYAETRLGVRLLPFRLYYPIPCHCVDHEEVETGDMPRTGYKQIFAEGLEKPISSAQHIKTGFLKVILLTLFFLK
ncbi:unnamed protein product [Orchesella dallaii]|uniref:Uncharacterized protein n=1 Tax=Orchesella dallaii TaxID=48710 RepID=A0ABP1Q7M4_9HEXA